uniref:Integrase catalytic domain-containing protein n=1 Tax=Candidatus Kentrum sp. TC TaxID=2126339 RepID=A0A450YWK0_9GAMM|nr:MAG: hypothetical protein BECKTC1821E_GA0114239_105712 [Candidatus Kentron sp. TC]
MRESFYYPYMVEDIYSRKVVGWEVRERENAEHASSLIRKASLAEGISRKGLVLHSDNGTPMKSSHHAGCFTALGCRPLIQSTLCQ